MIRALLLALALTCPATAAVEQSLTPEQSKAVGRIVTFCRQIGDKDTADKLEAGIADGTVTFGPTQGNANATCDMSTKRININPGSVEGVNSSDLESWRATANLAATISHELVHKGQDPWAWRGSVWREVAGYGNPCEQQAWGSTFNKMADWVRKTKAELGSKANRSVREQAEVAQRLRMMCQAFAVLRNDFVAERRNIGELGLTDADGVPITLDALMAEVKSHEKTARDVIGNASVIVRSFDGMYAGTFQGKGTGRIAFKIHGFTVSGRANGTYDGDPCQGAVSGKIDADGNLTLTLEGNLTSVSGILKGKTFAFKGSLTGHVRDGRAAGKWFASNKYGKPSGTWSAAQ